MKNRYVDPNKMTGWVVIDPAGYLARSKGLEPTANRTITYTLKVSDGEYIFTDYGGQGSVFRFLFPSGRMEWLAQDISTDDVLALVAAGVRTEIDADMFRGRL